MKKLIAGLAAALCLVSGATANTGGPAWDKFPAEKLQSTASLQNGAKLFVNYCLNCHAAAFMRYNRLTEIGLTEEQIRTNLLFAGDKVGDLMKVSMDARQAKDWFGATPPDLTLVARSRAGSQGTGADYLYTYLRGFYRDETKATGWNNTVFPSVAMPHVLWELQGEQVLGADHALTLAKPGLLDAKAYDNAVGDLVAYLQWMGEPVQFQRTKLGIAVLAFLLVLTFFAYRLNAAFWKDVK
ncbi:cytochrome c1 [Ideonella sp. 4Y11]|uniref:Cytochrome c1 n=1 Tax=Ideonella aquatica TaxID=2824119 RepID=A0A940YFS4_9BURK|nr:cytochrome c1 [Ideonella aquatica]MBQ0957381.1 cytochrome c1 [Ideonella aquatica]